MNAYRILILFFGLLFCNYAAADLAHQRDLFMQASAALQKGDYTKYRQLNTQLVNYPLYPYLRYAELRWHLNSVTPTQITAFLHDYADTPLASLLHYSWLEALAQQQRWHLYLNYYQPTPNLKLQCWYLQALAMTGQQQQALRTAPALWASAGTILPPCEPIFTLWKKAGGMNAEQVWQRLEQAVLSKDKALVSYLTTLLPASQQAEVKLWEKIRSNPTLILRSGLLSPQQPHAKQLLLDGIKRLANKQPEVVMKNWSIWNKNYRFTPAEAQTVIRAVGVGLARAHNPLAKQWLEQVSPANSDQVVREWRVRIAITEKNWPQVSYWISQLAPEERSSSCWRYWQARALAEQQKLAAAQAIYHELANNVDYYGWLASQQLHQPYHPVNKPYPVSSLVMATTTQLPAVQRTRELYALRFIDDAKREWQWALTHMNNNQLYAATRLVTQWGWYDQAIRTAAKAHDKNNISARYPVLYSQEVVTAAHEMRLNPAWVFAVMRQESAFTIDARSTVGAVGLMQLMPTTAKLLIKNLNIHRDLSKVGTNIRLGSLYLKQLADWYRGNLIMATTAYNAGPARIDKWLPLYKQLGADAWVEIIPLEETRDYIKSVLIATIVYQHIGYTNSSRPIKARANVLASTNSNSPPNGTP